MEIQRHDHASQTTVEEAERMIRSFQPLMAQGVPDMEAQSQIEGQVTALRAPADRHWTSGCVATLLSHYFVAHMPEGAMRAAADVWLSELRAYPAWSIESAARWWVSRENPDRKRKPLPGDISDIAHRKLAPVRIAEIALKRFEDGLPALEAKTIG